MITMSLIRDGQTPSKSYSHMLLTAKPLKTHAQPQYAYVEATNSQSHMIKDVPRYYVTFILCHSIFVCLGLNFLAIFFAPSNTSRTWTVCIKILEKKSTFTTVIYQCLTLVLQTMQNGSKQDRNRRLHQINTVASILFPVPKQTVLKH